MEQAEDLGEERLLFSHAHAWRLRTRRDIANVSLKSRKIVYFILRSFVALLSIEQSIVLNMVSIQKRLY